MNIQPGVYEHYKKNGNFYEVIGEGRNTDTDEPLIVYRSLYDDPEFPKGTLWVRRKENFLSEVEIDGKKFPRYTFVCETSKFARSAISTAVFPHPIP